MENAGQQPVDRSQQQQVSPQTSDDKNPQPLNAPVAQQTIEDPLLSNEQRPNEMNDVQFAQKNGNIVPVGPNEMKEADVLPLPYDLQENRQRKESERSVTDVNQIESNKELRQVIPPPNQIDDSLDDKKSSSNPPENEIAREIFDKKGRSAVANGNSKKVEEKLEKAQNNVDGILNQILRMIWRRGSLGTYDPSLVLFSLKILWAITLIVFRDGSSWKGYLSTYCVKTWWICS